MAYKKQSVGYKLPDGDLPFRRGSIKINPSFDENQNEIGPDGKPTGRGGIEQDNVIFNAVGLGMAGYAGAKGIQYAMKYAPGPNKIVLKKGVPTVSQAVKNAIAGLAFAKGGKLPKYYYGVDELPGTETVITGAGQKANPLMYGTESTQLQTFANQNPTVSQTVIDNPIKIATDSSQIQGSQLPKIPNNTNWAGIAGMGATVAGGLLDSATQKTTTDAFGTEYKTQGVGAAMGANALKGAGMGASFGPYGAAIGAGIGAIYGGITANKNNNMVDKAKAESVTRLTDMKNTMATSKLSNLKSQGYNNQGNGYSSIYRNGGYVKYPTGGNVEPQYEVEGNEVVQGQDTQLEGQENLASDMTKAIGPSHADGGVKGMGGERVFSDRLYASPLLHSYLSANKVKVGKKASYAEVAEKLGKAKGKYEEKLESNNFLINNTGKAMTARINELIEAVFQEQEMIKQQEEQAKQFADGGTLPDWGTLGNEDYKKDNSPVRVVNTPNYKETFIRDAVDNQNKVPSPEEISVITKAKHDKIKETGYIKSGVFAGDSNHMKAMSHLITKYELSPEVAAGIVGNLAQESNLNPNQHQIDGGGGYGIAQWTDAGRKKNLAAYAKSQGRDDLYTQLDFLMSEMKSGVGTGVNYIDKIKGKNLIDATSYFHDSMERSADKNMNKRTKRANEAYTSYKKYYNQLDHAKGGYIKKFDGGGDIAYLRKQHPAAGSMSDEQLLAMAKSKGFRGAPITSTPQEPTNVAPMVNKTSGNMESIQGEQNRQADMLGENNIPAYKYPKVNVRPNTSMEDFNNPEGDAIDNLPARTITESGVTSITSGYGKKATMPNFVPNKITNPLSNPYIQPRSSWEQSAKDAHTNEFPATPTTVTPAVTSATGTPTKTGNGINLNLPKDIGKNIDAGQIINAGVYMANLNNANKQKTNIKRQVATPTYIRNVNMLPYNKMSISREARTAGTAVDRMSGNVQDTFARKAAINVNAIEGMNTASMNQAALDMQTNNQNAAIENDYRNRVVSSANEDAIDKLQGQNAILTNKQAASNTFLQGVMGNMASNRAYDVEKQKIGIARIDAGRGTVGRSDAQLPWIKDYIDSRLTEKKAKGGKIKSKRKVGYC